MILSMTGYGRGEARTENIEVHIEIRTLNNRFLDISIKLPKACCQHEQDVKDIIKKQLERGRVNTSVLLNFTDRNHYQNIKFDLEAAADIWKQLQTLKQSLGLKNEPELYDLLQFQNIILAEPENSYDEEVWELIKQALESALKDLVNMRRKEGEQLYRDLIKRVKLLDDTIIKIEELSQARSQIEFDKLSQRLSKLADTEKLDPGRLEMEIAILADKVDVSEECIRFKSHNALFGETISDSTSGGRRLNFLLQEMNREANTIGAKANAAEIAHLVVKLKEEIEKIREQVQNIE